MIPFFTKDGKMPKFLPDENDIKRRKNMKVVYEYKKHNISLDEEVYHHIKKWKKEHNMKDFSAVVEYLLNYEEAKAKGKK